MSSLALEPDQALERCLNLVRAGETFAVEIDPTLVKDLVVVSTGAVLQEEEGFDYIRTRATDMEGACQLVWNMIHQERTFSVQRETKGDGRHEWLCHLRIRKTARDRWVRD